MIEFIVPDDYQGILKIRTGVSGGVDIKSIDGVMTLKFPHSGVLEISGESPIEKWHTPVARYASGRTIPVAGFGEAKTGDDVVALRGVGSSQRKGSETWYIVGKAGELRDAFERLHDFKLRD